MKTKKIIYIDTETTGLDKLKHGLREVGFIIEIDGKEVEKGLMKINPLTYNKEVEIDPKALEISGKDLVEITSDEYGESEYHFNYFIEILDNYVDKFNKEDKFIINGYNTSFDIGFIQEWFKDNDHKYFGAYFNYKELDVFALVKYLKHLDKFETVNDKLETICSHFGIELTAHNALDDIVATKKLNEILTQKYLSTDVPGLIQNTLNNLEAPDMFAELEAVILEYYLSKGFILYKDQGRHDVRWGFRVNIQSIHKQKSLNVQFWDDMDGENMVFKTTKNTLREMYQDAFEYFKIEEA